MKNKEVPKKLVSIIHFSIVGVLIFATILLFAISGGNLTKFKKVIFYISWFLVFVSLLTKVIFIFWMRQSSELLQAIILIVFIFIIFISWFSLKNVKAISLLTAIIIFSVIYMFYGKKIQSIISTRIENNSYFNEDNQDSSSDSKSDIDNEKTQIINN